MKSLTLSLILAMLLCGCEAPKETPVHLNIIVPEGSPALAQVMFEARRPTLEGATYQIERVFGPEPLLAAFGSQSHEIIFAPTNIGARLIASGSPYTLGAVVNFGNNYIVSNHPFQSMEELAGSHIIAFGEGATPDLVLRSLLHQSALESFDVPTIEYRGSSQEALAALMIDEEAIVLLAEPLVSIAMMQRDDLYVLSLQNEWFRLIGEEGYPQAGVFIHNDVPQKVAVAYLTQLQTLLEEALEHPLIAAEYAGTLDYPFPFAVLIEAIPRSNLRFVPAAEVRRSLETYFSIILEMNPALIGETLPKDAFYFKE